LLPYANLADDESWWHSQMIHFHVMKYCFPQSAMVPIEIYAINTEHRNYSRGIHTWQIRQSMAASYGQYVDLPLVEAPQLELIESWLGPFRTPEETKTHVLDHLASVGNACAPLVRRYQEWVDAA
jgi:hypothetical protein